MEQSQRIDLLKSELAGILGASCVIDDPLELLLYSGDVYAPGVTAALVIRPNQREELAAAVRAISDAGFAMTARGGGMTYTGGYTPSREQTVIIDTSSLNRIVGIHEQDMFITVEAGVTWQQIYEALRPLGLRLPFFGTFSGSLATVGGGLSNGALFMATARHGTAAEIVLGLELITADGRVIRTGQGAFYKGKPFYRSYGPDLTGLFVHDSGSLGIKIEVSLRLMKAPAETGYASFAFAGSPEMVRALSEIARSGAAEEAYVFDPATTRRSLQPASLKEDLRKLSSVIKSQSGLFKGLFEGTKLAAAGRRFVARDVFTLHVVCAGRCKEAVKADLTTCRSIAEECGGGEIANTIPKAARSNPFEPLNGIIGPQGERWAALNAKVTHSDAMSLIEKADKLLEGYRERMDATGVTTSFLFIAISNHAFSYEPVLRWFDEWGPLHRHVAEPAYLARLEEPPPNPEARALVDEIRADIVGLFADFGAASNQIGKTYPYLASMRPESAQLLRALKAELDPAGLMNPGALGAFEKPD